MLLFLRRIVLSLVFFFFKQKTAYEMRISDWSSDVCSSDLGHAADHDDFVDLGSLEAGIPERRLAGRDGALDQLVDQRLELGPGQLDVEMLRTAGVGGDEGQVDRKSVV